MTTCRLCSAPRLRPFAPMPGVSWEATGAFCEEHERLFMGHRLHRYADMRIGQAVAAFCLAADTHLPRGAK